jgi:hypothetical protein
MDQKQGSGLEHWEQALGAVLGEQRALVDALRPLAGRQRQLIEGGDTAALLEVLAARQGLIDRFMEADRRLGRLSEQMRRHVVELPPARRLALRERIDGINRDLEAVMASDEEDQRLLSAARSAAGQEIAAVDQGRAARAAYGRGRGAENQFADERG